MFMDLWARAVASQRDRIIIYSEKYFNEEGRTPYSGQYSTEAQAECFLFAMALHQVRMAAVLAQKISSSTSDTLTSALAEFDSVAPDVKRMRDVLVHFDDYVSGIGKMHQGHGSPTMKLSRRYGISYDEVERRARVTEYTANVIVSPALPALTVEVVGAAKAAIRLADMAIRDLQQSR